MRDLFVVKEERPKDTRMEFLSKHINNLQKKIILLNKNQEKQEKQILKQQEIIEKYVKEQKQLLDSIKNKEVEEPITENEEEYIMLDEKQPKIEIKEEIIPEVKSQLEIEAVQTVAKNKKPIIKQKILGIASKQRTTATKVKEIIVDRYKYCSKATFYRYLNELKKQHKLETISINDKEYMCNVSIDNKRHPF